MLTIGCITHNPVLDNSADIYIQLIANYREDVFPCCQMFTTSIYHLLIVDIQSIPIITIIVTRYN